MLDLCNSQRLCSGTNLYADLFGIVLTIKGYRKNTLPFSRAAIFVPDRGVPPSGMKLFLREPQDFVLYLRLAD